MGQRKTEIQSQTPSAPMYCVTSGTLSNAVVSYLMLHAMCCFVPWRSKKKSCAFRFRIRILCTAESELRCAARACDDAAGCHGWPTLCKRRRIRLSSPMPSGTRLASSENGSLPRALWRPAPPLRCCEKHGEVFVVNFRCAVTTVTSRFDCPVDTPDGAACQLATCRMVRSGQVYYSAEV